MGGLTKKLSGAINKVANPLATLTGHEDDGLVSKLNNPLVQVQEVGKDAMKGSKQMVNSVAALWKKNHDDAIDVGNPSGEDKAAMEAAANAPRVIPAPDTDNIARARRRAAQARLNRGRASTILGGDAETLG